MRTTLSLVVTLPALAVSLAGSAAWAQDRLPLPVAYPAGIAPDGQGGFWVATLQTASDPGSQNELVHLDATGAPLAVVEGGPGRVFQELVFDGAGLWTIEMYDELVRLDATGEPTVSIDLEGMATGMAWDPSRQRFFVLRADGGSHAIDVIGPDGTVERSVTTAAAHTYWWGLAFDGCSLWTSDIHDDELIRLDADTGAELARVDAPATSVEGLAFDGTRLLGADSGSDVLVTIAVGPVELAGGTCTPQLQVAPPAADFGAPGAPPVDNGGNVGGGGGGQPPSGGDDGAPADDGAGSGPTEPPADSPIDNDSGEEPPADAPGSDDGAAEIVGGIELTDGPVVDEPGAGCACSGASTAPIALVLAALLRRRRR